MDTEPQKVTTLARENSRLRAMLREARKENTPDLSTIYGCLMHFCMRMDVPVKELTRKAGVPRQSMYQTCGSHLRFSKLSQFCVVLGVKVSDVILLWEANQKKEVDAS